MKSQYPEHRVIALIIFVILVFILAMIAITDMAGGEEELMQCDDCQKQILLDYDGDAVTAVHLRYNWDD